MFGKQSFVFLFLLGIGACLTVVSRYQVQHLGAIDINQLRQAELKRHNQLRGKHGCPSLSLDNTLNNAAQTYANTLLRNHVMQHSPEARNGKYGQNLAWRWAYPKLDYKPGDASQSWYDQIKFYDYETQESTNSSKAIGHFTAMIWKSATKVGFGFAYGPETRKQYNGYAIYVVANYSPVTNVIGQYDQNVPRPL